MKICMVVNNINEFGGLEEFATNLAIGVQRQGHQVCMLSTVWVDPENQYAHLLAADHLPIIQLPRWLSLTISDWETKEKILLVVLKILIPLIFLLAIVVVLSKRRGWEASWASARNWLRGQLMSRIIGPDRRQPFTRVLLNWWSIRWHPDLIHIQGYTSDLLYIIDWAFDKKIPLIYEEHQTPDAQFDWWKDFSKTINKASTVVAVSEKSAEALREVCGVTQPIEVAYYMVPDPAEAGWEEDATPKKINEPVCITTNARLYVTKGLPYLLETIVKVKSVHPSTQFRVYGDGPLREELLDYAKQLGLDGRQIFVGTYTSRAHLACIMAETDIFVISSILEGLPLALLEAMSYGRAVVVTLVGGIPEAIEDGVNGLLCAPRDPDCLSDRICRLIEDPSLRLKLGHAARQSYELGPYHPAAVSSRYISIYEKVLATQSLS